MEKRVEVGQTLFSVNIGNALRYGGKQVITPVKVIKVGRKYFWATEEENIDRPHMHVKYCIDGWKQVSEYSPTSELHANKQEWEDKELIRRICKAVNNSTEYGKNKLDISIEDLVEVYNIFQKYKEDL